MTSETVVPHEQDTQAVRTAAGRIGDAFVVVEDRIECGVCSHVLGPRTQDPKLGGVVAERKLSELNELNRFGTLDELVLREYYCPECGAMLAANVQRPGDPVLIELELD